jgi:hypothetical protein
MSFCSAAAMAARPSIRPSSGVRRRDWSTNRFSDAGRVPCPGLLEPDSVDLERGFFLRRQIDRRLDDRRFGRRGFFGRRGTGDRRRHAQQTDQ